jgi:hypothetical protein
VLHEFPGYTSHVRWLPCEDFPVLTEELDERIFLLETKVCPYGGGLGGITDDKFHLLCINYRLEARRRGGNFLLGCRHLGGVCGGMDFLELFTKQDSLREGGFTFLALFCLPEAAITTRDKRISDKLSS